MLARLRSLARPQAAAALAGLAALEAIFAALRRLGDLKVHVIETIALGLAAGVVYFVALYALEHSPERRAASWLVLAGALLFRLTLAPLEPTLSDDIHRYRWEGAVQQAGWNPYAVPPADPRLAPLRDSLGPSHWAAMPGHEIRTIYPPVSELVYRLTWRVLPGPVGFKLPFLLADLLVVAMLAGWMRSSGGTAFHLAIYAWNPLVIVEFAGSAHNDALALVLVVAALLIIRRYQAVSTLLLTAAALAKAFPAVLFPLWLRRGGWRNALWAAALAAACAWPYRSAWPYVRETFNYYESRWQNYHASLFSVIAWFSGSRELAAGLGVGIVAGMAVWMAARRTDPIRAAYLLFGAILMLAPNGYSWYFTWIVPLLCFFPNPAWLLLTVLQFLSYNVLIDYQADGRWHFDPLMQWLTYGPFYALLLWQAWRDRKPFGAETP
jgi:alpha-1,6-mannosyltransferase